MHPLSLTAIIIERQWMGGMLSKTRVHLALNERKLSNRVVTIRFGSKRLANFKEFFPLLPF
jgi:hypothetical protein